MSKAAITSIWDWSAHYLAAMFLIHQRYEDDETTSVWMDNNNLRRVYIYDELDDDGFVEYYMDGVVKGVRAKEDVRLGE